MHLHYQINRPGQMCAATVVNLTEYIFDEVMDVKGRLFRQRRRLLQRASLRDKLNCPCIFPRSALGQLKAVRLYTSAAAGWKKWSGRAQRRVGQPLGQQPV